MICPMFRDYYTGEQAECLGGHCAWWLGESCAVAYIGANCRANLRPWNDRRQ